MVFEKELNLINIAPKESHEPGIYDANLRFYFMDNPWLQLKIPVTIEITECVTESASFANDSLIASYIVGEEALSVNLPSIQVKPNCKKSPRIKNYVLTPIELQEGSNLKDLVDFDSIK